MSVTDDRLASVRSAIGRYWQRQSDDRAREAARAAKPAEPRKHEEADTQAAIIKALRKLPDVWCARNTVGTGRYDNGGIVAYGLGKGSADILCVVAPRARACWLEVKSSTGRQTPHQAEFQARQEALGAVYRVCRSVEDALEAVEEARRGP